MIRRILRRCEDSIFDLFAEFAGNSLYLFLPKNLVAMDDGNLLSHKSVAVRHHNRGRHEHDNRSQH